MGNRTGCIIYVLAPTKGLSVLLLATYIHTCVKLQNTVSIIISQGCILGGSPCPYWMFGPPLRFIVWLLICLPQYAGKGNFVPPPFLLERNPEYSSVSRLPLRVLVGRAASWEGLPAPTQSEQKNYWRRGSLDKDRRPGCSSTPGKS